MSISSNSTFDFLGKSLFEHYDRKQFALATIPRAYASINLDVRNGKRHELGQRTALADKALTDDEKLYVINLLNKHLDKYKVRDNRGTRRICENCKGDCLAASYCEHCIRSYLKARFSTWTSGNDEIDRLIQRCQEKTLSPSKVVEWIPYHRLQNIRYLTKGGFSEIYIADWTDGRYDEWDSKKLNRLGMQKVILKKLEKVTHANRSWFEEGESHLMISNRWDRIVQCYGFTRDPLDGNYMLVMSKMDLDLRNYLQRYHNRITTKERVEIIHYIVLSLFRIHKEGAIHRDLHSGNILYSSEFRNWLIGDLGFCGPVDKPLECIYGNLPYIAPEVINGNETTFKSDIYSIGMLMWEVSSGQPPFFNYKHDFDLAMKIINGMRPKIPSGIPLEYRRLMEQCWAADPSERPDVYTLLEKIRNLNMSYQRMPSKSSRLEINNNYNDLEINKSSSRLSRSKIHWFEDFPEPRNAIEDEDDAYINPNLHSEEQDDLEIP